MPVAARLSGVGTFLAADFDETALTKVSVSGLGTAFSNEFDENTSTTLSGSQRMSATSSGGLIVYDTINEIDPFGDIPTDGLQLYLDSGNSSSYSGSGSTWTDLSGNGRDATLTGSSVVNLVGSAEGANTTSISLSGITGIQDGDFILVITYGDDATVATPSGYTSIAGGTGTTATSTRYRLSYKFRSGDTSVTISAPSSGEYVTLVCVFRGVDSTSPLVDPTGGTRAEATTGNADPPSITTTINNTMVVPIVIHDDSVGTATPPSGYTLISSPSATQGTVAASYLLLTTAGTEDPGAYSGLASDQWISFTLGLQSSGTPSLPTYSSSNGGILTFDGLTQYAYVSGYKGVTGTGARTSIIWFKTNTINAFTRFFGWGGIAAAGNKWVMNSSNTLYTLVLGTSNGASKGAGATTQNITDGNWHMVASSAPASGTVADINLYVDGELLTDVTADLGSTAINTSSDADVSIAASLADLTPEYLNGSVSQVLIYNRQLSDLEIKIIYRSILNRYLT